MNCSTK